MRGGGLAGVVVKAALAVTVMVIVAYFAAIVVGVVAIACILIAGIRALINRTRQPQNLPPSHMNTRIVSHARTYQMGPAHDEEISDDEGVVIIIVPRPPRGRS